MSRIIGLMSGSSLDGLDIVDVEFVEKNNNWTFVIHHALTIPYTDEWYEKLSNAMNLDTRSYLLLTTSYGSYIGDCINEFIKQFSINKSDIDLICSHGHTVYHEPSNRMTSQIGDGASIVARTNLRVVNDLRSMDVALGGQGAPIVPIGEKYLFSNYRLLLNIGGITNISVQNKDGKYIAFDICPANRILNKLAKNQDETYKYDDRGKLASSGVINQNLLNDLNQLDYYKKSYPKSLSNSFGLDTVYPIIENYAQMKTNDKLATYNEHIVVQIINAIQMVYENENENFNNCKLLITGGGGHNDFLIERLIEELKRSFMIQVYLPEANVIDYKEALIMAFIGLLRLQNKPNILASVTGAEHDSVGGSLWSV
ncbi:unnamed protein product [Didymodactylos carnosus]|uniref:Anhydro-N-acetylmuramic acid kinase n=1 Tax=Didymodactylos carnosus TaxID=1234261 RepID=A0A813QF98_9BILA|nr:unnamed protein product [Didymodactylos carnosus]CAF0766234.1 unnamed protein product [Didymodactylos carnosus]CAF3540576.1 unnamed protein product [Didymodactylos carnosus]CAF3547644.1 unnamed protein product [Didymodactylos carnosus]